ncbi:hypothetical protein BGX38DRAFT_1186091, partial [Terfezia claveryi]
TEEDLAEGESDLTEADSGAASRSAKRKYASGRSPSQAFSSTSFASSSSCMTFSGLGVFRFPLAFVGSASPPPFLPPLLTLTFFSLTLPSLSLSISLTSHSTLLSQFLSAALKSTTYISPSLNHASATPFSPAVLNHPFASSFLPPSSPPWWERYSPQINAHAGSPLAFAARSILLRYPLTIAPLAAAREACEPGGRGELFARWYRAIVAEGSPSSSASVMRCVAVERREEVGGVDLCRVMPRRVSVLGEILNSIHTPPPPRHVSCVVDGRDRSVGEK